jgi:4-amino-4-deoxy-L-arabinose transferase-like glycosyltransferase
MSVIAVLVLAGALRGVWLNADPPTVTTVGVVWHDEGAWTHNARNQALWGVWRTDAWNPMFIAPVFTALETVAFKTFGVGTWQARTVPVASGLIVVFALMWGLSAVTTRRAALLGGLMLATSYTFVMWNRAALMESTMTMFIVVAWAACAHASTRPRWGVVAGIAVVLAFFTKASAAFFVAAVMVELATEWWPQRKHFRHFRHFRHFPIAIGLLSASLIALAFFVLPYWTEFQFYNWAMTVTRKPEYTREAFQERMTFLTLAHGVFTRMWFVTVVAAVAATQIAARWRTAHPAERLAVLWVLLGLLELVVHDSGVERRYVMFVPAFVALATMAIGPAEASAKAGDPTSNITTRLVVTLTVGVMAFVVFGGGLRLMWLDDVLLSHYKVTIRVTGALTALVAVGVWWQWPRWGSAIGRARVPMAVVVGMALFTCGTDLTLYREWATHRTQFNYEASRALAGLLPPGTLVHGKLANGLALENRIAPLFVGRGFGNYADRLERDDARYILTYTEANGLPRLGYEGPVILDVLQHYPNQRIIATFAVKETPGSDRAVLIDKFPDGPESRARHQ